MSSALNFITDPSTPTGRLLLVGAILFSLALAPWVGKGLVALIRGIIDIAKIFATGKVLTDLAKLEPEQAERRHGHLEQIRPPPDQLQPPAAS